MKHKRLLHSVSAKSTINPILIIALVAVALVAFGVIDISNIELPSFSVADSGDGPAPGQVAVDKAVQFGLINKYAGTALTSKTLKVYDAQTFALRDTLTTDATTGKVATTHNYISGTKLYVYYESSNDKLWIPVTVPYMNEADAQASTYNDVTLEAFAIGTYTTDTLTHAGTTINDAGSYNKTTSGDEVTFTYSLANTGADNTGLMTSYDPVYKCNYDVWVVVTFSGTNYETIVQSGFDRVFELGSTTYACSKVSANRLTKWRVGSSFVPGYTGMDSVNFSLDLTGYSGDGTTMQIYAYAYADPVYAMNHGGSFGPERVEIAEQTVTLED